MHRTRESKAGAITATAAEDRPCHWSSQQMATLVQGARAKAPPIQQLSPHQHGHDRPPTAPPAARQRVCQPGRPAVTHTAKAGPVAEPATMPAEPDDFPTGWELKKESWHFHRRFYRVLRRPMRQGEVLLPSASDLAAPRRAPRRALLARHPARRQDNAGGHRNTLAPDHHPAEELAADAGRWPAAVRRYDEQACVRVKVRAPGCKTEHVAGPQHPAFARLQRTAAHHSARRRLHWPGEPPLSTAGKQVGEPVRYQARS